MRIKISVTNAARAAHAAEPLSVRHTKHGLPTNTRQGEPRRVFPRQTSIGHLGSGPCLWSRTVTPGHPPKIAPSLPAPLKEWI